MTSIRDLEPAPHIRDIQHFTTFPDVDVDEIPEPSRIDGINPG